MRADIEAVDRQILALLAKRRRLALLAGAVKRRSGEPARDATVENEVVARYETAVDATGLTRAESAQLARKLLRASRRIQQRTLRVAIQGARGSYSDEASARWAPDRALLGCPTFAGALDAMQRGECDVAVLPVWNTTIGPIEEVLGELERRPVRVVSLVTLPIRHAVLAPKGVRPTKLYGHAKALLQCPKALAERWGLVETVEEDAASVAERWQAVGPEPGAGLLGNPHLAALYGLTTLDADMSDIEGNATTFALVALRED